MTRGRTPIPSGVNGRARRQGRCQFHAHVKKAGASPWVPSCAHFAHLADRRSAGMESHGIDR
jgi:hypothetical protein